MIAIRSEEELRHLRVSGAILAEVFAELEPLVVPGMWADELDRIAAELIQAQGARPAFKGYRGYPAHICVSIDEEVVHGIPGHRQLKAGQLVGVDIGVEKEGYFGDAAKTFLIGAVSPEKERLVRETEAALWRGIKQAVARNRLGDISYAVQSHIEAQGYSVVRDLTGHGIGRRLQEDPQVPNYGTPHTGPRLKQGMVLAIEPMVNMGGWRVHAKDDGWTVVTADGSPSAHFEHTIAVLNGSAEILTRV